ncbi:MAG: hypothetical protein WBD87_16245 [Candidatus Acidiferrales bacterium]
MKRSGGVTAAAVVLIVVSAVVTFGAFFATLAGVMLQAAGPKMPASVFARTLGASLAVFVLAAWGIVTGVGLLRLRRWAWFCVLIISALLLADAIPGLVHARKLIRATTGVPTVGAGGLIAFEYIGLALTTLVPLALAIWWLALFTRRSVRAQLAPGVTLDATPPVAFQSPSAFATPAQPLASPRMQLSYRRPVSVTVIAVFLLAGAAFFPLIFLYPRNWRMTMMFGVFLTGRNMILVSIPWFAANVALGIGLLRLRPWARIGTVAYCIVSILNVALTARHLAPFMDAVHKAMGIPAPPMPAGFMRVMSLVGLVFGLGLNLVAIYFLVTRRAAFHAPPSASSSSALDANPAAPT